MGADPSGLHMDKVSECTASGLSFQELSSRLSPRVCPHCSDSQDMSHHPHRRTSGSGLLERGGREESCQIQLNPGFWQLVGLFFFF